jgi:uncharacterized OB-fold protein
MNIDEQAAADAIMSERGKGWECPRCGVVHSPETKMCFCPKKIRVFEIPKPKPWRTTHEQP